MASPAQKVQTRATPQPPNSIRRILVLEDRTLTRHALRTVLHRGHTVHTASDIPAALSILSNGFRPDAVITENIIRGQGSVQIGDQHRTVFSGLELLQAAKALRPNISTVLLDASATHLYRVPSANDEMDGVDVVVLRDDRAVSHVAIALEVLELHRTRSCGVAITTPLTEPRQS